MDVESDILSRLGQLSLSEKTAIQISKQADPHYVLDLDVQNSKDEPLVAAACSDFNLRIFSRSRLACVTTIPGHRKTITGVRFGKTQTSLVYSCTSDNSLRCWDTRMKPAKQIQQYQVPSSIRTGLMCMDVSHSGRLLCAGTEASKGDAFLLFWDTRNGQSVLGCYEECHQDDITQACFKNSSDRYLATSSTDGLVCTFDLEEQEEDDALQITLNAESPVAKIGWCGSSWENVYCVTTDNTFHVWEALEGNECCSVTDLEDIYKDEEDGHYIVDCIPAHTTHNASEEALLLTGTNNGCLKLVKYSDSGLDVVSTLEKGHTATVRCSHWDEHSQSLLTGGEDSFLCLWSPETSDSTETEKRQSKIKSHDVTPSRTNKPYSKKPTK